MGARHLGSNEHPLTHTPDGLTNDVLGAVDFRGVDEGRSQFDPTEEGIHPAAIAPDPYANLWDHYAGTAEWFQFHEWYSLSGQSGEAPYAVISLSAQTQARAEKSTKTWE